MMAQRAFQILVVLLLIFPLRIFSQQQVPPVGKNTSHALGFNKQFQRQFIESRTGYRTTEIIISLPYCYTTNEAYMDFGGISPVTAKNLTVPSAFFCKKELQFENATSIPLRFRLGSLDYVNRLEGKEKWFGSDIH